MIIKREDKRDTELIARLSEIWRRSVEKTHDFLTKDDIEGISHYVPDLIGKVPVLVTANDGAEPLGFMGIDGHRLEMLFLDPDAMGKGIGKALLRYGIDECKVNELTVNEDNPSAAGFYRHMGFAEYRRTDTDEDGRPFPLLYMRRP